MNVKDFFEHILSRSLSINGLGGTSNACLKQSVFEPTIPSLEGWYLIQARQRVRARLKESGLFIKIVRTLAMSWIFKERLFCRCLQVSRNQCFFKNGYSSNDKKRRFRTEPITAIRLILPLNHRLNRRHSSYA